jgi:starvation-inducible DNA-binding protein
MTMRAAPQIMKPALMPALSVIAVAMTGAIAIEPAMPASHRPSALARCRPGTRCWTRAMGGMSVRLRRRRRLMTSAPITSAMQPKPPSGGQAWEGVRMNPARPHDPMAALNDFLSEVIDVVMALRQAHRKVPEAHQLHAELDQLYSDARMWAELLVEADTARGVSALDYMPSGAGRPRPNLWPGRVSDDEVREVVTQQLHRLGEHLRAALSEQDDDRVRGVLDRISLEIQAHLDALMKL